MYHFESNGVKYNAEAQWNILWIELCKNRKNAQRIAFINKRITAYKVHSIDKNQISCAIAINKPNLICIDYGFPDLPGLQLLRHIRFSGKPLGRPPKVTLENQDEMKRLKSRRRQGYQQRIPIEGKFGQGKYGYRLNNIRARRADTSLAATQISRCARNDSFSTTC